MNACACRTTATAAITLPAHMLLILAAAITMLGLLICIGIALPAVWSAKPARRKAAAAVLHQILTARTRNERR